VITQYDDEKVIVDQLMKVYDSVSPQSYLKMVESNSNILNAYLIDIGYDPNTNKFTIYNSTNLISGYIVQEENFEPYETDYLKIKDLNSRGRRNNIDDSERYISVTLPNAFQYDKVDFFSESFCSLTKEYFYPFFNNLEIAKRTRNSSYFIYDIIKKKSSCELILDTDNLKTVLSTVNENRGKLLLYMLTGCKKSYNEYGPYYQYESCNQPKARINRGSGKKISLYDENMHYIYNKDLGTESGLNGQSNNEIIICGSPTSFNQIFGMPYTKAPYSRESYKTRLYYYSKCTSANKESFLLCLTPYHIRSKVSEDDINWFYNENKSDNIVDDIEIDITYSKIQELFETSNLVQFDHIFGFGTCSHILNTSLMYYEDEYLFIKKNFSKLNYDLIYNFMNNCTQNLSEIGIIDEFFPILPYKEERFTKFGFKLSENSTLSDDDFVDRTVNLNIDNDIYLDFYIDKKFLLNDDRVIRFSFEDKMREVYGEEYIINPERFKFYIKRRDTDSFVDRSELFYSSITVTSTGKLTIDFSDKVDSLYAEEMVEGSIIRCIYNNQYSFEENLTSIYDEEYSCQMYKVKNPINYDDLPNKNTFVFMNGCLLIPEINSAYSHYINEDYGIKDESGDSLVNFIGIKPNSFNAYYRTFFRSLDGNENAELTNDYLSVSNIQYIKALKTLSTDEYLKNNFLTTLYGDYYFRIGDNRYRENVSYLTLKRRRSYKKQEGIDDLKIYKNRFKYRTYGYKNQINQFEDTSSNNLIYFIPSYDDNSKFRVRKQGKHLLLFAQNFDLNPNNVEIYIDRRRVNNKNIIRCEDYSNVIEIVNSIYSETSEFVVLIKYQLTNKMKDELEVKGIVPKYLSSNEFSSYNSNISLITQTSMILEPDGSSFPPNEIPIKYFTKSKKSYDMNSYYAKDGTNLEQKVDIWGDSTVVENHHGIEDYTPFFYVPIDTSLSNTNNYEENPLVYNFYLALNHIQKKNGLSIYKNLRNLNANHFLNDEDYTFNKIINGRFFPLTYLSDLQKMDEDKTIEIPRVFYLFKKD